MNRKIKTWFILLAIITSIILVRELLNQKFTSVEGLQNYMKGFGIAAPLFLTLFQAFQVVVPVLPGYLGCAAGAVAFGSTTGFFVFGKTLVYFSL